MKKLSKILAVALSLILLLEVLPTQLLATALDADQSAAETAQTADLQEETSAEDLAVEEEQQPALILGEDESLRTENTKHFRLEDGSYMAATYPAPVHYQEDGAWKDVDVRLSAQTDSKADGRAVLRAQKSAVPVELPQKLTQNERITLSSKGYTIGFGVSSNNAGVRFNKTAKQTELAELRSNNLDEPPLLSWEGIKNAAKELFTADGAAQDVPEDAKTVEQRNTEKTKVENNASAVVYENVFPDTDLEYVVNATGVKENIVIESAKEDYTYRFAVDLGGLVPVPQEDGAIWLTEADKPGDAIFVLQAPYMYDAGDAYSDAVAMTLENGIVTVSADAQWLNAEERMFPVVVDPTIATSPVTDKVEQAYVASGEKNNTHPYGNMFVGYDSSNLKVCRGYLKFEFPEIPTSSIITSAQLWMYQRDYSCVPSDTTKTTYELRHVSNTSWQANQLTWANMPGYDTGIVTDYATTSSANNVRNDNNNAERALKFDVTKLVKGVYEAANAGTGAKKLSVMVKGVNETTTTPYANTRLYSANHPDLPSSGYPYIYFNYRDTKGLEARWTYTTLSAGRAGTAHINDYSGNLVFEHQDAATTGLRMPVSLSSFYNSCIAETPRPGKNDENEIRSGNGWQLSLLQRVEPSAAAGLTGDSAAAYPYFYLDGDGTRHFFYKDTENGNKLIDEDGLGLELIVQNGSTKYKIQDDKDNVMLFNANGYLKEIKDANNNTATIGYHSGGNRIATITDGAGHILTLSSSASTSGNFYLNTIADPAGRITTYYYDTGHLIKIKYPDNSFSEYEYTSAGRLYRAISPDGGGLHFAYNSDGSVAWVREFGGTPNEPMSKTGYTCRFDRSKYNTTVIESPGLDGAVNLGDENSPSNEDNIFTTLQFDNHGRTISSIAKKGSTILGAGTSSYTKGSEASNADIKKRNRVVTSGSLARNAVNLAINHGAEASLGSEWGSSLLGSGATSAFTLARTAEEKYQGKYSLRLNSTKMEGTDAARAYQNFYDPQVKGGNTYTLSAYVKVSSLTKTTTSADFGAALNLNAFAPSGNISVYSEFVDEVTDTAIDDGWRRVFCTILVPADFTLLRVNLVLRGATGKAYFDNIQLENAGVLNACNLLENTSLERGSGISPTNWTGSNLHATNDGVATNTKQQGLQSFKMTGEVMKNKELKQDVVVNGTSRDTYILSGWGSANALNRSDARFDMMATVTYASGTTKDRRMISFNNCVNTWQFASGVFTLGTGDNSSDLPVKITVRLRYCKQANNGYFDNIQLIKDSAPSYVYDGDGNPISISANAENKSAMEYTNGDLTKTVDAKGYEYKYTYDSKHNMTQARSQRGVTSNYLYDSRGNATELEVRNSGKSMKIRTEVNYTDGGGNEGPDSASDNISAGGYVETIDDQDDNRSYYFYNQTKGTLMSSKNANNVTTSYAYQSNTDRLTSVTSGGATVSYGYANSRLSSITHNGFSYNLLYDAYGNVTQTKVGNQLLAKNTYGGWNSGLESVTYGNGDVTEYTYGNYGISSIKKGDSTDTDTKYNWSYNNSGTVWKHTDAVNGLTHRYSYDSIDRLVQQRTLTSDGAVQSETQFGYDEKNNATRIINSAGGRTVSTVYNYGDDNLPVFTKLSGATRMYEYVHDSLNRLTDINLNTESPVNLHYYYRPSNRNTGTETSYRTTQIGTEMIGLRAYAYTYDVLGNITEIREGSRPNYDTNAGSNYAVKVSYVYDSLNRLTRENNVYKNKTTVYTYNAGGNITSKKEYAYTTGTVGTLLNSDAYTYDTTWKDKLTAYDGTTITYDQIGNPKSYRGYTMTWEGRQLKTLSGNNNTGGSYKYNADGLRSKKTINGVTSEYQWVGGTLMSEKRGSTVYHYQYDALGNIARISYQDGTSTPAYFPVCNSRGDVEAIYNSSGSLMARYIYDAWGGIISIQNASGTEITNQDHIAHRNPFRYRGYYYDSETGLYYLQSRYYDPVVGRFLNADAQLNPNVGISGFNMFAYCGNNPVMFFDPSGFCPLLYICPGKGTMDCMDTPNLLRSVQTRSKVSLSDITETKKVSTNGLPSTGKRVLDATEKVGDLADAASGTGLYALKNSTTFAKGPFATQVAVSKYPALTSSLKTVGTVGTVIGVGVTAIEVIDITTNPSLSNEQKWAGTGIAVGGLAGGVAVGYLAVAVANVWNPAGITMLAAVPAGALVSGAIVLFGGTIIVDGVQDILYEQVGIYR